MGPDFGKDIHNPSRAAYKTKAGILKLLESAVADCAPVIRQQGDAGLDRTTPFGWETGRHVVHNSRQQSGAGVAELIERPARSEF